ncbi:MAG TPA: hypothetical protein VF956_02105 [Candidatus Dormibacteraeota bacterium]
MSKRKRSTSKETPPATPSEGGEGAPTVHVSSDMLAGSPDIWAPGKDKPVESSDVASEEPKPAAEAETVSEEPPSMSEAVPTEEEKGEAVAAETAVTAPPPPTYQPRPPAYVAPGPTTRRAGSSIAFGVVLVVLGLFALLVQFTGFDAGESWPLFVIIPGLTLLVVGYVSLGTGALIPGAILTVVGLILAYQSSSGDWPSWAFVWPLVAPGGVGLGLYLQGVRNHDPHLLRQGRVLMFVAAIIFMIAFVIFGVVLNIGGYNYGVFGKAALPALLILVGLVLLARSIQRTRQA